jgi:hypothetical protein
MSPTSEQRDNQGSNQHKGRKLNPVGKAMDASEPPQIMGTTAAIGQDQLGIGAKKPIVV